MRSLYEQKIAEAKEIDGRLSSGQGKIVRPLFGPVAKAVWPFNTDAEIATIADCDVRTARRYLRGENDPPAIVYAVMWLKIIESRKPTG